MKMLRLLQISMYDSNLMLTVLDLGVDVQLDIESGVRYRYRYFLDVDRCRTRLRYRYIFIYIIYINMDLIRQQGGLAGTRACAPLENRSEEAFSDDLGQVVRPWFALETALSVTSSSSSAAAIPLPTCPRQPLHHPQGGVTGWAHGALARGASSTKVGVAARTFDTARNVSTVIFGCKPLQVSPCLLQGGRWFLFAGSSCGAWSPCFQGCWGTELSALSDLRCGLARAGVTLFMQMQLFMQRQVAA